MMLASVSFLLVGKSPPNDCHLHLCPRGVQSYLLPFWWSLQDQQVGWTHALFQRMPLHWHSRVCETFVHALWEKPVSSNSLALPFTSNVGLQSQWVGAPVHVQESWMWGLHPSRLGQNFATVIIHHLWCQRVWILTIMCLHPSYQSRCICFFLSLIVGGISGIFQVIVIDSYSVKCYNFGKLMCSWEKMS